jgi:hypothetical protein
MHLLKGPCQNLGFAVGFPELGEIIVGKQKVWFLCTPFLAALLSANFNLYHRPGETLSILCSYTSGAWQPKAVHPEAFSEPASFGRFIDTALKLCFVN